MLHGVGESTAQGSERKEVKKITKCLRNVILAEMPEMYENDNKSELAAKRENMDALS